MTFPGDRLKKESEDKLKKVHLGYLAHRKHWPKDIEHSLDKEFRKKKAAGKVTDLCECGHRRDQHETKDSRPGAGDCRGGYCSCYGFLEKS